MQGAPRRRCLERIRLPASASDRSSHPACALFCAGLACSAGDAGVAGGFEPVTRVDGPHRGAITALAYHPAAALAVTASLDGEFKARKISGTPESALFRQSRRFLPAPLSGCLPDGSRRGPSAPTPLQTWARGDGGKRGAAAWRCRSVGFYQGHPLLAAAFSPDGSLLAVSGGGLVTLWEPLQNTHVGTLAAPALPYAEATRLVFAQSSPHLVTASEGPSGQVCVWDLLRLQLASSMQLDCRALSLDAGGSRVAAVVRPPAGKARTEGHYSIIQSCPFPLPWLAECAPPGARARP